MTNTWTYRDDIATGMSGRSLAGYDVEATDGGIGSIDEHSDPPGAGYLIVDTGFWIFGKKRLVPAGVVQRVDHDEEKVYVGMTKDQIKAAPDYDDTARRDGLRRLVPRVDRELLRHVRLVIAG